MSLGSGREGREGTGASQAPQALGAFALVRSSLTAHLAEGAGVWLPTCLREAQALAQTLVQLPLLFPMGGVMFGLGL